MPSLVCSCLVHRQHPQLHHRLTWLHLSNGSPTRADLEAFVAGHDLGDLTILKNLVYLFKLIPTVERVQEGDHSIVNRMVQYRKVSGPYVSLCLRLPEVRVIMSCQDSYKAFLSKFSDVMQLDDLAKKFGFFQHPLWVSACQNKARKKAKCELAAVLMYNMDIEGQYENMKGVKKARERHANKRKHAEEQWKASWHGKKIFGQEALEQEAMADHLQSERQVGRLYSLPSSATSIQSLSDALKPVHLQQPRGPPEPPEFALVSDVHDDTFQMQPEAPEREPVAFFWRLTCARPSRHKLVRLPAASGQRLAPEDLCVTLHRAIRSDHGCFVEVEPTSTEGLRMPLAVLSVFRANFSEVAEGLLGWSTRKELAFTLTGLENFMTPVMMSFLQKMVAARAFPASGDVEASYHVVDACEVEELRCVARLEEFGVIAVARDASRDEVERRKCVFTFQGMQRLKHLHGTEAPSRFLKTMPELRDLEPDEWQDCTTWELMLLLKDRGWQLRRSPTPPTVKRHPLPPIRAEALENNQLFWYVRGLKLQQYVPYMLTLLRAASMFESGALCELHHCQSQKYYQSILNGTSDGVINVMPIEDGRPAVAQLALDVAEDFQPQQPADAAQPVPAERLAEHPGELRAPGNSVQHLLELLIMGKVASLVTVKAGRWCWSLRPKMAMRRMMMLMVRMRVLKVAAQPPTADLPSDRPQNFPRLRLQNFPRLQHLQRLQARAPMLCCLTHQVRTLCRGLKQRLFLKCRGMSEVIEAGR